MIRPALVKYRLLHRSHSTELTDLLPENHEILHSRAALAGGVAVATLEGGPAGGDGTVDHFLNGSKNFRILVFFDLTAQACGPDASVSTDLVGDVVAGAREVLLLQESDLERSARHTL